jgi:hypothetical protein
MEVIMKSSHLLVTFFLALGFVAQDVSFIYAMERSKASSASPNEQLLQSAMEGNIDGVRAAIAQGARRFVVIDSVRGEKQDLSCSKGERLEP